MDAGGDDDDYDEDEKEEDDGVDDDDDDDDEDDDDDDDVNESELSRISWLPNVLLGKQPYRPFPAGGESSSRREGATGEGCESVGVVAGWGDRGVGGGNPPGYRNIEILPVLPMTMVRGLEGMSADDGDDDDDDNDDDGARYGAGVWEDNGGDYANGIIGIPSSRADAPPSSSAGDVDGAGGRVSGGLFSGTSGYLPHTRGHVFTVAEPRYKRLYDDLLKLGDYRGAVSAGGGGGDGAAIVRRGMEGGGGGDRDPDERGRFIVTAANPDEDGVFAEYGLLFQLRDLDEVAAVGDMGGGMSLEEAFEEATNGFGGGYDSDDEDNDDDDDDDNEDEDEDEDEDDVMDVLLRTHYEATHDVVGRVRIHRFVNPECYSDGPEGEEYLMAEATVLDSVETDRTRMRKLLEDRGNERRASSSTGASSSPPSAATTASLNLEGQQQPRQQRMRAAGDVAEAVARIKEELRSSVGEAYEQNRGGQHHPPPHADAADGAKEKMRPNLDGAVAAIPPHEKPNDASASSSSAPSSSARKGQIPLGGKGAYVERRSDDSLTKEERSLRESFASLVALQHELKEECRFTRVSVQTFGVGPVGVWLSAAAWSQFVEKRLEATYDGMQSELQAKLVEYLADDGESGGGRGISGGYVNAKHAEDDDVIEGSGYVEVGETINFEDLSPELQYEFQLVQARASEELGPLALERAIQMQCMVQAESYSERLDLLRECVDNERRRLEAKKMLKSLAYYQDGGGADRKGSAAFYSGGRTSRERARTVFERLISTDVANKEQLNGQDEEAFQ